MLESDFIEGEDFIKQKTDYQRFPKNEESNSGGDLRSIEYFLSVSCLEFFIARKIRSVFDIFM
ncbi:hypothetical protein EZS27_009194 [termite gut metagenome]|uniref:Uncharacterized protein n=1 Tax=termite gut metagenome TaxID=433724 RepID=A0A5J4SB77_9ZZZZ